MEKIKVMIVDDQYIARQLFEMYIKSSEKYKLVMQVDSAALATKALKGNPVDLILMDILMSDGSNGLSAACEIKKFRPEVKIIAVTSMPETSWLTRAREIGIDSFWYKEASKETILQVMDRTMSGESVYPDKLPVLQIGLATSEEFTARELEVLRELTSGDTDDEIPLLYTAASGGYSAIDTTFLDAFGIFTRDVDCAFQADENGKVKLANISDNYKEFLKFMHKLYEEGLMEQEAFTITGEEVTTKEQGDVYGSFGWGSAPFVMAGKDISYDANWLGLSGLTSDIHSKRETSIASPVQNGIMIAVNANTQYPEAMARFLDYFYTDEGMLSTTKGYEGVTFDMVQDDLLGIEIPEMKVPDGYSSGEEYRYKGAVLNEALNLVERNLDREALFNGGQDLLEKPEIVEKYGWAARVLDAYKADGVTGVDSYPVVSYTTEEIEERSPIYKDLTTYLQQAKAQFITGELDVDQDWDTYVNTVEQMNASRLLEIEQAAYDRFTAIKE